MTEAEYRFKRSCQALLIMRRIPTPKALHDLDGHGTGRALNGAQCRWRVEVMEAFGCTLEGEGPQARWRLSPLNFIPSPLPAPTR